ncbi:Zn-dependent proteases [Roseibium album]|nr:Zn-dependent proteases [Roseibium album]
MGESFLSADWYRVAPLKCRLRAHVEIHRQRFRGQTWHLVQDHHTGKFHRITPAANLIVCLMDGRRTLQELWEEACERFEDEPPTQSEVIKLLSQLHAADLIAGDIPPDMGEMGRRHSKQERQAMLARLRNPLALRFSVFDPDAFLNATVWLVRPFFTVWGLLAWLGLVGTGAAFAAIHWAELTDNLADRVLTAENGLLIALAYPLVKAIHELGHAYAAKIWGGEVHEIGIMFLVLIPVPYVDASTSSAFPEKRRRIVVGAAGIMVELALAAGATLVWVHAESGILTAFMFNVMLIGGVSTLFFNGNPLLRFDGYFVLCDLIEIPNLGTRSNKYFWYLVQTYALGVPEVESPVSAQGERGWLLFYAVTSFFYRIFISIAISLFIATKFFVIGVILAIWAISNVFLLPVAKGLKFMFVSPKLRGRRTRATVLAATSLGCMALALFALPVPYATVAHGVVWLEDRAILRARAEGFVAEVVTERGEVITGETILRLEDPVLASETEITLARLDELRLRLASVLLIDLVQANLLREQIRHFEGKLELATARSEALTLKAGRPGWVLVPGASDMIGRMFREGEVVGYLLDQADLRLRVAVDQDQAELVRGRTGGVEVLLQRDLTHPVMAHLSRNVPESRAQLPSPALSTSAGGEFALDPTDTEGRRTLQRVFQFEVIPDEPLPVSYIGERALVRFDHGHEPLGFRFLRSLRQLFLRQFDV